MADNKKDPGVEAQSSAEKSTPDTVTPIVGIGASAGGLEALTPLLTAMPVDAGIAYVLVLHLDPTHISLMPNLLRKHTSMPVHQIEDGTKVEPDHVYVIPPKMNLSILNGTLLLTELSKSRGLNLPIDSFLRSLAKDQGSLATCIILSGTGTDGTLGVKAIKGEAGMVMAQDPESAQYTGMPLSAAGTGLVDYVLPPALMPQQLTKYLHHSLQQTSTEIDTSDRGMLIFLQKIYAVLRDRTGHDFSLYKSNTIIRRIERRMNVHQIDEVGAYVTFLQSSDREAHVLFKELLIGVTSFFRDPEAFDFLKTRTIPKMLVDVPDDYSFRIWVTGCASGEEAYSLAILMQEVMDTLNRRFHVQIFGTDIDEAAINVARAGIYPESICADVGPDRIKRFFTQDESGQFRVKKMIREMVVFAPQNVIKDPPFTKLDLLSCRNLLIYMGQELQLKLLPIFHYSLKNDGVLFLGSSETVGSASSLFSVSQKKFRIFHKEESETSPYLIMSLPTNRRVADIRELDVPRNIRKAEELSMLQLVESILHQSQIPTCVIINEDRDVIYIHGRTGRFLEPAEGRASVNIIEMARPSLRKELTAAISQVASTRAAAVIRGLEIEDNGGKLYLNMTVKPILEQTMMRGLVMIEFEETSKRSKRWKGKEVVKGPRKSVPQLEEELIHIKDTLQSTIEELEAANEELKSTNEELQSTNEELQSTNEELETSKEELQSLNEESVTVNAELQARIDDLSNTNDDMKNLLDSTDIATIFLDAQLQVRRFTPRATDIVPLTSADCGRPISHLSSGLSSVDLAEYGRMVLDDLVVREVEAPCSSGKEYIMKVRPYRTAANLIDGVVITFEDFTHRNRAEKSLTNNHRVMQLALQAGNIGVFELNLESGLGVWSKRISELWGVPSDYEGNFLEYCWDHVHPLDSDRVKAAFEEIVESREVGQMEFRILQPTGAIKWVRWCGQVQQPRSDAPLVVMGVNQDITAFKESGSG